METVKLYALSAVFLVVASLLGFMGWKLYTQQVKLGEAQGQITVLEANNKILDANVATLTGSLEGVKKEYEDYRDLHSVADSEVKRIREQAKGSAARQAAFELEIRKLTEDLNSAEAEILRNKIPSPIIDAYNATGVLDVSEGVLSDTP